MKTPNKKLAKREFSINKLVIVEALKVLVNSYLDRNEKVHLLQEI